MSNMLRKSVDFGVDEDMNLRGSKTSCSIVRKSIGSRNTGGSSGRNIGDGGGAGGESVIGDVIQCIRVSVSATM